jgi:uncharacterized protein (DUF433 family)
METALSDRPEGGLMSNLPSAPNLLDPRAEQWMIERTQSASRELADCIELNPAKCGGVPVLKGTRISVAQILAEIGEGQSAVEVAQDYDLDAELVKRLVKGLAVYLDRAVS